MGEGREVSFMSEKQVIIWFEVLHRKVREQYGLSIRSKKKKRIIGDKPKIGDWG